jgi:hypothetical protein
MLIATSAFLLAMSVCAPADDDSPEGCTLSELRSLATAIEAYAADQQRYPDAETIHELKDILEPKYVIRMTGKDGWGSHSRYAANRQRSRYALISAGSDRVFEEDSERIRCVPRPQRAADKDGADLIYEGCRFRVVPAAYDRALEIRDIPRVEIPCTEEPSP